MDRQRVVQLAYARDEPQSVAIWKDRAIASYGGVHYHDFYEYCIVIHGEAIHSVNGVDKLFTRGTLIFIRPNDIHSLRKYQTDDFAMANVGVRVDEFDRLELSAAERQELLGQYMPKETVLSDEALNFLLGQLTFELSLPKESAAERMRILRGALNFVISLLFYGDDVNVTLPTWFNDALHWLNENDDAIKDVASLVEFSGKSYSHVNRCFKKYLGITPTRYMTLKRLSKAKALLSDSDLKVVDICYAAGFDSLSYFYKCFDENLGVTPTQYRAANQTAK